ncbi:BON domain-containing protein [Sneathiella limimaris]|uniref:BON domain-containing protein n=1 Tax=Sneathiella limimaris TaxID=1964213 RepID=UPI00146EAC41|nr:BON domain-containing protein [Sneathiella limimaris]
MSRRQNRLWCVIAVLGLFTSGLLSGCTPVGVAVGGAAAAGVVVAEERSVEDAVSDAGIKLAIVDKLLQESESLFTDVSTTVIEGRVLVTGAVASQADKDRVAELIWSVKSVKAVLNELQLEDEINNSSTSDDVWITTSLKSRLLRDIGIKHINYSVDTVNRVVYLIGIAQDEAELRRVMLQARDISGVRRIVSHVIMKDDPSRN